METMRLRLLYLKDMKMYNLTILWRFPRARRGVLLPWAVTRLFTPISTALNMSGGFLASGGSRQGAVLDVPDWGKKTVSALICSCFRDEGFALLAENSRICKPAEARTRPARQSRC